MNALTVQEGKDLTRLEGIISRGLGTFREVGEALAEIRDRKLYRLSHKTFEGYCQEKWGFGRRRGDQLIKASEIAHNLGTNVLKNEAQAREMGKHSPAVQQAAVAQVQGTPTAAKLRDMLTDLTLEEKVQKTREEEADALKDIPSGQTKNQRGVGEAKARIKHHLEAALRLGEKFLLDVADKFGREIRQAIRTAEGSAE